MTRAPFPAFPRDELPRDRALRLGSDRLQSAIAELPVRYAPFYGRLAGLWNMSEARVQSELSRAKDPKTWSLTPLPGLRSFEVDVGAERQDERARLLRFAPDAHFPRHEHRDTECVLVLEGAYVDGAGLEAHAGDEQTMAKGSAHELTIIGGLPCVTAISERGIDFTSPWLRWVNWLMR